MFGGDPMGDRWNICRTIKFYNKNWREGNYFGENRPSKKNWSTIGTKRDKLITLNEKEKALFDKLTSRPV